MINFCVSKTEDELRGIIQLQKRNLHKNLNEDEINSQGFVTVSHSLNDLKRMNDIEAHVIIKDNERVIGYLLAMTEKSSNDIPVLIPMFDAFKKIKFRNKFVSEYIYMVVGQVCIAKDYRGKGLLDKCYDYYKEYYGRKYDFAITEIAVNNIRSINAHKRIGFEEVHRYSDGMKNDWSIVVWDWNSNRSQ